ncbi:MAG: fructose 1,6-bisphosphatase [Thaumarchaeota archaeon]|jgi:myo-inositol-1(or 4)-monophosphatase|nr:fructose 1,6-bisphosphatase [Nitrososphaerota archaeon]MBT4057608.1 fructose 1,6-bisphosphatase [Nitrososphaerota archaeon]MBT4175815.1 fructose 1,6-bisphosphatase [Nitrososphaerota archaeon]MBT4509260.1 fructose 1,6-bisphosphatase [Nitrososphaerota archaeon]MBT4973579.1 fructose 1,6-bisphosphatase [Nitrososphaerota archaeon]
MESNLVLKEASRRIYEAVKDMAGTEKAAGDFGRGAGGDISRNIDITAETTVLDYLKEINFECIVLGEECGRVELSENPKGFVIMDAIDGSANAVRGVPFFCSSLAFATENRLSSITDGVITNLSTGEMYSASQGKGAFLDDKQISVYKGTPLYKIVGVNTSGASQEIMKKLQPVFEHHSHTRHFGANALEMAMFSQGLMDVFIDLRDKIRIQDIAAGYIIVKEAGGLLLDSELNPLDADLSYDTRVSFIAAANQGILDEILPREK